MATGRIVSLFLLSTIVSRSIGPAGLFRAIKSSGRVLQKPFGNIGELSLLPNLLKRMSDEWRLLGRLIYYRSGGGHRVMNFCWRLKSVFWHSQCWPKDLDTAYVFRVGTDQQEGVSTANRAGWREMILLAGALSCLALSVVSWRF